MRKLVLLSFVIVASLQFCGAQSLDKMQWFNEPEQWEIKDKSLSMQVTPKVTIGGFPLRVYGR